MSVGISKHEIEFLFRNARFNLEQTNNIGELCKILGKYLFLDRTLLDARVGKKIGLSYLQKAVEHHIITEMQHQNPNGKKDVFYYQLGMGGQYLLEKAGEPYCKMNILANEEIKGYILAFNYFALEQSYDIDLKYAQDHSHRFFFCKGGRICYFANLIKEMDIIRILILMFTTAEGPPSVEEIRNTFNFIQIDKKQIEIGSKTKTTFQC